MSGEKVLREPVAGGGAVSADTCSRIGRRKVWRLDTA